LNKNKLILQFTNTLNLPGVTEEELQELSEMLLLLDIDNVGSAISLDLGGTTSTGQTQVKSISNLY
jgi:hypothetical protein